MYGKFYFSFMLGLLLTAAVYGQNKPTRVVTDADLGTGSYLWSQDTVYLLDGYVFLETGGILNIERGTVVKGINKPTNASDNASALIITKGAMINARGTAEEPIIFTAELDDVNDPTDLGALDKGLWGGLILLGNATVGEDGGFDNIEGIPADEGRAQYGGDNDADNSGSLCYISIRHGGAALQADNEINGLTLGGVGSGTQIHHIEVFANEDDGIEFFGGTVDLKYGATIFCGDDGFDYDESWGGRGQFWFYISETDNGNCAGEHDGSERTDKQPKSFPVIYNATYIGSGSASGNAASIGLDMKDDAAAVYANSVFTGFSTGVRFRNRGTSDAYSRYMTDGDTKFLNNLWWDFAAGNDPNNFVVITDNQNGGVVGDVVAKLVAEGNQVVNPQLSGISRTPNQQLDPRPNSGSPAYSNAVAATDEWFDAVTYRGAFDAKNNWMLSWTATDELGYFGDLFNPTVEFVRDEDLVAGGTYTFTNDKEWILDGYVFLEEGGSLTIQPGTVIKGKNQPTNASDNASALIITKGATINACGTADQPIIFTAELDDVNDPTDLGAQDKGLWGGLILLGNATVGEDG
ncbi:MAG: T9SS C-terminal target domain-containing protein, partial [Saprospiraceae bacterium]|nr:T9SS C-terminal target domain-containing protein [Saprospiraceae bacterium]